MRKDAELSDKGCAPRQRGARIETADNYQSNYQPRDARPGNGARGLKQLIIINRVINREMRAPATGREKQLREGLARHSALDARPGNGARGLKLDGRVVAKYQFMMRAPATGRED